MNLISGALGGNAAGKLFSNLSLGTIGNSIVGIVGGGLGGKIIKYGRNCNWVRWA